MACKDNQHITSEPPLSEGKVNKLAVWGAMSTGQGYAQARELTAVLDVPYMGDRTFLHHQKEVSKAWQAALEIDTAKAAEEEFRLAEANGQVKSDGIAEIAVIVDCGWSHRSYGHSYNAGSGAAVIIGERTKKILHCGVKNKRCKTCYEAAKKGTQPSLSHDCVKNFQGPSTAMEQSIIVEGFQQSQEKYSLRYVTLIGDGDSSVMKAIRTKVSYGRNVQKVPCANHLTKCYTSHLYKACKDTQIPVSLRKLLETRISRLSRAARGAIRYSKEHGNAERLVRELRNSQHHVFGDHSACTRSGSAAGWVCSRIDDNEVNHVP